jgi:hypothetical protein
LKILTGSGYRTDIEEIDEMNRNSGEGPLKIPDGDVAEKNDLHFQVDPSLVASISQFARRMQQACTGVGEAVRDILSVAQQCGQMMAHAVNVDVKPLLESLIGLRDNLNAFVELNPPKKMAADYGWPPMFDMDFAYLADVYKGAQEKEDEGELESPVVVYESRATMGVAREWSGGRSPKRNSRARARLISPIEKRRPSCHPSLEEC